MKEMSAIELGIYWNIEEYYKKCISEGKTKEAIKIKLIELIDEATEGKITLKK